MENMNTKREKIRSPISLLETHLLVHIAINFSLILNNEPNHNRRKLNLCT